MDIVYVEDYSTFKREFKSIKKKYRSFDADFQNLKKVVIEPLHIKGLDFGAVVEIPNLGNEEWRTYKIRKIACKSLKGRGAQSGIRITYTFNEKTKELVFLEIYLKSDSSIEDKARIRKFIKEKSSE